MRLKTLTILAAITVPVLAAAILIPSGGGTPTETAAGVLVYPTLGAWMPSATRLVVTGPNGVLTLDRKGPPPADPADKAGVPASGWTLAEKGGYPVEENVIRPVLQGLIALKHVAPKTERPKLYDRLQVQPPQPQPSPAAPPGIGGPPPNEAKLVELSDGNGAPIVKLIIGKRRYDRMGGADDGIYIRNPDEGRAWLAQPAFDLPAEALGWIDRKLLDLDAGKIKSFRLEVADAPPLTLSREKPEQPLAIEALPKDRKPKGDNPGAELGAVFRYLDLLDVRPASELNQPVRSKVHLVQLDGLTVDVTLVAQDGGQWLTVAASGSGDSAKAAADLSQRTKGWAYKIPDTRAKTLETKLADITEAVPPADTKLPDAKSPDSKSPDSRGSDSKPAAKK